MSFTGEAESAAIIAMLDAVGTVLEDVPDDYQPTPDWDGSPGDAYMVVSFGSPTPTARGRGLGVTEAGQPHILPFQVTYIGPTTSGVRALRAAGDTALIGKVPVAGNSNEIKGSGGFIPPSLSTESKPSVARHIRWYTVVLNGTVDELA